VLDPSIEYYPSEGSYPPCPCCAVFLDEGELELSLDKVYFERWYNFSTFVQNCDETKCPTDTKSISFHAERVSYTVSGSISLSLKGVVTGTLGGAKTFFKPAWTTTENLDLELCQKGRAYQIDQQYRCWRATGPYAIFEVQGIPPPGACGDAMAPGDKIYYYREMECEIEDPIFDSGVDSQQRASTYCHEVCCNACDTE
jgi:hypothetical protein